MLREPMFYSTVLQGNEMRMGCMPGTEGETREGGGWRDAELRELCADV